MPDDPRDGDVTGVPLPCIWMSAGLLRYHLCDRDLECDRCPLDAALRRVGRTAGARSTPAGGRFPADRRYDRRHAWISAAGARRVRFGLDAWAAAVLGAPTGIVLPAPRTRIERERAACWIEVHGEILPVRAPLTGLVTRVNRALQLDPSLLAASPYDDGWLVELRPTPGAIRENGALVDAESQARRTALDEQALRERAVLLLAARDPALGPTLQDGGELHAEWRRALAPAAFVRLILPFLA